MGATQQIDPLKFAKLCWPDVKFYREQQEIIYSVRDNYETIVPAGNELGKDFVSAFIVLWFFCSRHPVRIVTTSTDENQLNAVLWGEMNRFIDTAATRLPIHVKHQELRLRLGRRLCKFSYVLGRVAKRGEGMLGHHANVTQCCNYQIPADDTPRTLFLVDEASGVDDENYDKATSWAKRILVIGNPFPCANFFYRGVKEGSKRDQSNGHYYRKVIRIKAEDSPNVRFALDQIKAGATPTHEVILPGPKTYAKYLEHRAHWDRVKQCVGLDGEFYEGAEALLYPPNWLNLAESKAASLSPGRQAKAIGVDVAEGVDSTSWAVIDEQGLIHLLSAKTPDTSVILTRTIGLAKQFKVPAHMVCFDRGGGGKQLVDVLRQRGFNCTTVSFGESASDPDKLRTYRRNMHQRREELESRTTYRNRRAEMYGLLRERLDPGVHGENGVFGIPAEYTELRRQLAPIPLQYDEEGRMRLLPKNRKTPNSTEMTLVDLIGRSPDDADALVIALFTVLRKKPVLAGVVPRSKTA